MRIVEQHYRRDLLPNEKDAVGEMSATFAVFDDLCRKGRDSVWTYVARNLSRPLALAFGTGWANVVVGNPPWVAFRHMSADLKMRFRELARGERVYVGGRFATQNDLAALFTVRATVLYLRSGGRIAFVLPLAALTRGQFDALRKGSFTGARIAWDEAWTMDDSVQPLFPVPACVVFGKRRATSRALPETVRAYTGTLPFRDAPESIADKRLMVTEGAPRPAEGKFTGGSAYREAFRQGATLVPRMLCLVERRSMGRLGGDPTTPHVVSRRSNQEKQPWKSLPGIEHRVEAGFLHQVLLGESILPYRVFQPFEGVVPVTLDGVVLDAQAAGNRGFSGLHGWMSAAEAVWNGDRPSPISLIQQFDYYGKLSAQFPLAPLRVVYAKAGTLPAACLVRNPCVIDHMLYWAPALSDQEGYYLAAILNSEAARARVAGLQSRGQWGARHFDKVIFTLPIPPFDAAVSLHRDLADAARDAETIAIAVALPPNVKFQHARRLVRDALRADGVDLRINRLVAEVLESPSPP